MSKYQGVNRDQGQLSSFREDQTSRSLGQRAPPQPSVLLIELPMPQVKQAGIACGPSTLAFAMKDPSDDSRWSESGAEC